MPRLSDKEVRRREVFNLFIASLVRRGSRHPLTRRWLAILEAFAEERYMQPRVAVPKSDWAVSILPQYSDIRWRAFSRMNAESFQYIIRLISGNEVFYNNSSCQQAPVETQLKIALWKLSNDGSGSGIRVSASQWGVSEGHVNDCTRRVVAALFQLREQFIRWPSAMERRRESFANDEREGFLGVVGKADGTDIVLQYKPGGVFDGEAFWNRKKRYAIDLCGVCDTSKRFIYMLTGFSSATHDGPDSTISEGLTPR